MVASCLCLSVIAGALFITSIVGQGWPWLLPVPFCRQVGHGVLGTLAAVDLDDVTFARVGPVLQPHPALIAGVHLAHVILEASERRDSAVIDDLATACYPRRRATADDAIAHVAAHNRLAAPGAEDRTHLGVAVDYLAELRLNEATQRLLDVVEQIVDDLVLPDLHTLLLGKGLHRSVDAHVEGDDNGPRRHGQVDVVLGWRADGIVDDAH